MAKGGIRVDEYTIHLSQEETIVLSADAARRLIAAGSGDAALLYLALLQNHGAMAPGKLLEQLRWDQGRLNQAEAALMNCGLVGSHRPALSEEPDLDYGAFARAMEVEDPRWAGQAAMFDKLYRSGATYRFDQLAISAGQLAVLGIRDQKAAWVMRKLLDAVIKTPELNSYPPLEMMARTLAQQYK